MGYANAYWRGAIAIALDEEGIEVTSEQLDRLGESLAISAEHEGQATGREMIPNPMLAEVESAKRRAEAERKEHEAELAKAEKRRESDVSALRYRISELQTQIERAGR
jgi:hypothetical protein